MKYLHTVEIKVFLKSPFDSETVFKEKIDQLVMTLAEVKNFKKDVFIKRTIIPKTEDFPEDIIILSYKILKSKDAEHFFMQMRGNFTPDILDKIDSDLDLRIDDEATLCFRLDKDSFLSDTLVLVTHGNCIHITLHIAAYPSNKKNALVVYERYLDEMRKNSN